MAGSKRAINDAISHVLISGDHDPSMVRRDGDPVWHVALAQRDATHFARSGRVADIETDHGAPGRHGDQVVVAGHGRKRAVRSLLPRKRGDQPRRRCVTRQAVHQVETAVERRHQQRLAIVEEARLGGEEALDRPPRLLATETSATRQGLRDARPAGCATRRRRGPCPCPWTSSRSDRRRARSRRCTPATADRRRHSSPSWSARVHLW